jgi:hypothetical protein
VKNCPVFYKDEFGKYDVNNNLLNPFNKNEDQSLLKKSTRFIISGKLLADNSMIENG